MSILIKGMDMPTEGTVIAIYKLNGQFYATVHGTELCLLVPVPKPHGRLIDADALMKKGMPLSFSVQKWVQEVDIACAPTIIEAEGEDNGGEY